MGGYLYIDTSSVFPFTFLTQMAGNHTQAYIYTIHRHAINHAQAYR